MTQLPTLYQQFIHKSRYARWLEKEGRREHWDETVDRYLEFFGGAVDAGPQLEQVIPEIRKSILNLEVMPSMRALMTAGPALKRDAMAGFNCLGGETLVTTQEHGIVPISTLAGKSVHVVDGNGDWTLSKCRSYGKQKLSTVEFGTSGGGSFQVRATPDHRWILKGGDECLTKELDRGARIATVAMPSRPAIDEGSEDYRLGVVHGLIYGDGTAQYKQHNQGNPHQAKISSVDRTGTAMEEVFCFEVPTTKSFLLTKGILTGNCAYVAIDHMRAFDESMYVLMCGTGIGYSVERQSINKLPEVSEEMHATDTTITVHDSKIGWAKALRELLSLLYAGQVPSWDVSKVRPAGSRLKTFGGRASGPAPLVALFEFAVNLFRNAAGRKLTSLECHDLMCMIADTVVVGGVRRSAMICLSNLSDDRMRNAKSGRWYETQPQRALANNSAVYTERPDMQIFMEEWKALFESHSGERGIFNRQGATKIVEALGKRDASYEFGCNPCSEIILRSMGVCNLSEIIVRRGDSLAVLKKKARIAAILGTLQATQTNFRYVRKGWVKNAQEERLLGVSLTGLMDHEILSEVSEESRKWLRALRKVAVKVNEEWSGILGIPAAAAVTAVKPSGTVSQLVDCASGLHARYSPQYIRTVRGDAKDPLSNFMISQGIPFEPAVGKPEVLVFSFPIKSPANAVTEGSRSALEQLEYWKMLQEDWCEHKPSCTVYYKEEEFLGVGDWIYKNFDSISGISFLPYDNHVYQQAPYQPVDEETWGAANVALPKKIDWSQLAAFESEDNTAGSQTYACSGGVCETVDISE